MIHNWPIRLETMVTDEFLENSACVRMEQRCGDWQSQRSDPGVQYGCGFRLLETVRSWSIHLPFL